MWAPRGLLVLLWLGALAGPVRALDKQGSAHGGAVAGEDNGFNVSGAFMLGSALYNQSYAARPDNTGLALLRYAAHVDVDLLGRRLSVPLDVNLFTDRLHRGARVLQPTELDIIAGVTSTWDLTPGSLNLGAVEFGGRVEHDRPADRWEGFTQTYADIRARYLFSLATTMPRLAPLLLGGDVNGWFTLGWFALNRTYAARPDNTGVALLRYATHGELSLLEDAVSVALDGTFFTDRTAANPLRPTELDLTVEFILHVGSYELHLAYEQDSPLDRPGLTQSFVYALVVVGWDIRGLTPPPLRAREGPISP